MKHLSPTDPVPTLRGDLVFSGKPYGSGAEVIHIRPIGFGDTTQLHGFELSLARLLDGHRTAQDVINQASRIGLPLTLPALEGFIDYLQSHALIARSELEANNGVSPWSERVEWDPIVRMQYQSALKALRAGRADEARQRLDRLLATAPLLDEARTLRVWMELHPGAALEGESFAETFQKAQRGWLHRHAPVARIERTRPASELDREELSAVRPSFGPMAALIAIVVVAVIGLLFPIPYVVSVPAQLTPVAETPIIAQSGGRIDRVLVREGQTVNAGEILVTYAVPSGESLSAPTYGTVRDLFAADEQPVAEGQQLMLLEDTRQLRVMAHLDARQARDVRVGQAATIALGARRAQAVISAVSGREVVATIDNRAADMEPGHAVIDIDVGKRSLFQRIR